MKPYVYLTMLCTYMTSATLQAQNCGMQQNSGTTCTEIILNCAGELNTSFSNPTTAGLLANTWRFANVASGLNAEVKLVTISNMTLATIDDDAVGVELFAPKLTPAAGIANTLTSGFAEFEISFYDALLGNGYSTAKNLVNMQYVHFDIDGAAAGANYFRETGAIKLAAPNNPAIQVMAPIAGTDVGNVPVMENTRLTAYSTNTANNITNGLQGYYGSTCERTGIAKCSDVALRAAYSSPQSKLTIRLGYERYGNTDPVGSPERQYATKIGCFQFPTVQSLPVGFTTFKANKINKNTVQLDWNTTSEIDNMGFTVERSVGNSNNFVPVIQVHSLGNNGTSTSPLHYSVIDKPTTTGNVYYRIKQLERNGMVYYSTTRSVSFIAEKDITIYPNPSITGNINITIPTSMYGATIVVKNAAGAAVYSQLATADVHTIHSLSAGIYYLTIIKNNQQLSAQKLVVQPK